MLTKRLFFKRLPNHLMHFKDKKCQVVKSHRVFNCVNVHGTEKFKLLTINKSAAPRCYENNKSFRMLYCFNVKA